MRYSGWRQSPNMDEILDALLNLSSLSDYEKEEIKQIRYICRSSGMLDDSSGEYIDQMMSKYGDQI